MIWKRREVESLRAYGVDLRTSVTGPRPPVRRLPPPAAGGGAGVAAGAEASRAAETTTRLEDDHDNGQQEAELFLHNLALSDGR